ncbi:MAG TPA: helix-turn-helix domain-containing protein [Acidimicrobiales bacterium]|nr:helix-turn-helix domain-containing protein [Acidimicrobiales bacterium]
MVLEDPSTIVRADGSIEHLPPGRSGPARRVAHGTRMLYRRGCRCGPCSDANKAAMSAYRAGGSRRRPMVSARELREFFSEDSEPAEEAVAEPAVRGWGSWLPPKGRPGEPRPFAFAPLEKVAGEGKVLGLARAMGLKWREYVYRWRARGLSVWEADVLACRLGMHPSEVWGDLWWTAGDLALWCPACGEPDGTGSLWCASCGEPMLPRGAEDEDLEPCEEVRIGQLLGPPQPEAGPGRGKPSTTTDGLSRDERHDFRKMAAEPEVVEEPVALSISEAAKYLGVSAATAYRMVRDGTFPAPVMQVGRWWKVSPAAIEQHRRSGSPLAQRRRRGVTMAQAQTLAGRVGLRPIEIWPPSRVSTRAQL